MSEDKLKVFHTSQTKELFPIDPSNLLGGNNTVIMADPRKGKSYTAAKVCEQLCKVGIPFVIIDPEGEYYSLREKFSVLVAGVQKLENCDISVGEEHAELLVRQFLNERASMIFDLSGPDVEEDVIHEFLAEFMKILIREEGSARLPCLVVIDEADEFIPERGHKTRGSDYAQFGKLVKKGGKRGIGTIIISHRPSWVAKDLLAKCQNWVLMNQRYKDDLERLEDLTRIPLDTLMHLKERDVGEALLYGAVTGDQIVWAKCLSRETTHIGTTPTVKPKFVERPELDDLLEGFRVEVERLTVRREAERSEIERLETRARNLEADLKKSEDEIKMLRTAREAAKMVTAPPQPIRVETTSTPSLEEYNSLKQRVKDLEAELEDWVMASKSGVSASFSIDDFGNISTPYAWLTRLIDLSRVKAIIVKHLMENKKGCTAESIALNYGFSVDTIREHLNELIKKGVARRNDARPYRYFLREN